MSFLLLPEERLEVATSQQTVFPNTYNWHEEVSATQFVPSMQYGDRARRSVNGNTFRSAESLHLEH
jgi:hypothetical protein